MYVTIISSIPSIGAMFGFFFVKNFMKIGRMKCLHLTNLILIVSYSISLIDSIPVLIVARFFLGFASGGFTCTIVPQYIYETSPMCLRGILGALTQINLNFGILLCFIIGYGTPTTKEDMHTSQYWRFMFIFPVSVCIIQSLLILIFFNYETPYYLLLSKKDEAGALKVLKKLYVGEDAEKVLEYIKETNKIASSF